MRNNLTLICNTFFENYNRSKRRHPGRHHEIFLFLKTLLDSGINSVVFLKLRYLYQPFKKRIIEIKYTSVCGGGGGVFLYMGVIEKC